MPTLLLQGLILSLWAGGVVSSPYVLENGVSLYSLQDRSLDPYQFPVRKPGRNSDLYAMRTTCNNPRPFNELIGGGAVRATREGDGKYTFKDQYGVAIGVYCGDDCGTYAPDAVRETPYASEVNDRSSIHNCNTYGLFGEFRGSDCKACEGGFFIDRCVGGPGAMRVLPLATCSPCAAGGRTGKTNADAHHHPRPRHVRSSALCNVDKNTYWSNSEYIGDDNSGAYVQFPMQCGKDYFDLLEQGDAARFMPTRCTKWCYQCPSNHYSDDWNRDTACKKCPSGSCSVPGSKKCGPCTLPANVAVGNPAALAPITPGKGGTIASGAAAAAAHGCAWAAALAATAVGVWARRS